MDITPVAFDSFGVKSSCVKVKTQDVTITIDPGIAVEAGSFPLPKEKKLYYEWEYKHKIKESCQESDIIIISHYHYDHYRPIKELYKGKTVLLKDYKEKINKSQKGRAKKLMKILDKVAKEVKIADSKSFEFGSTKISFSKPLFHGIEDSRLGYVIMPKVEAEGATFLHSSDIDGPYLEKYVDLIAEKDPDTLVLDGAPSYLLGFIMSYYNLARVILNTVDLLERIEADPIILDHHLLRDYRFPELYYEVYKKAEELNKEVSTAAELKGWEPKVLEGYEKNGPSKWKNWDKFKKEDMIQVLKNAVENELIKEKWLKRARELGKKTV